jgi:hypothetical protein
LTHPKAEFRAESSRGRARYFHGFPANIPDVYDSGSRRRFGSIDHFHI